MAGTKLGGGAAYGGSAVPTVAGAGADVTADINVTPMIDVMLVLLIIFMVVTPALAFEAKLPKARTAAPEKEERVTLGIDKAGKYFVDDKPVSDAQLEQTLRDAYAKRPDDHVLYLKAHDESTYARTLTAIDAARNAGVRRIGAITEMPQGAPRPH
jgi:biopolymer transport protein ExbD/biopolymer transport protein TolR